MARYFNIAIASVLLICADAFFTVYYISEGIGREWNPLISGPARWLGLELTLALRTYIATLGVTYLAVKAHSPAPVPNTGSRMPQRATIFARVGLYVIFGVYLLVNVYHVLGAIVWL